MEHLKWLVGFKFQLCCCLNKGQERVKDVGRLAGNTHEMNFSPTPLCSKAYLGDAKCVKGEGHFPKTPHKRTHSPPPKSSPASLPRWPTSTSYPYIPSAPFINKPFNLYHCEMSNAQRVFLWLVSVLSRNEGWSNSSSFPSPRVVWSK